MKKRYLSRFILCTINEKKLSTRTWGKKQEKWRSNWKSLTANFSMFRLLLVTFLSVNNSISLFLSIQFWKKFGRVFIKRWKIQIQPANCIYWSNIITLRKSSWLRRKSLIKLNWKHPDFSLARRNYNHYTLKKKTLLRHFNLKFCIARPVKKVNREFLGTVTNLCAT